MKFFLNILIVRQRRHKQEQIKKVARALNRRESGLACFCPVHVCGKGLVARALNRRERGLACFCPVHVCGKGLVARLSMDAEKERRPAYEYVLKTLVLRMNEDKKNIEKWKDVFLNAEKALGEYLNLLALRAIPVLQRQREIISRIHEDIEHSKTQLEMFCKRGVDYNTEYQALLIQALQEYLPRTH